MSDLSRYREQFPVTRSLAYFNHAAVSPLSTPARRAMEALLADVNEQGALHWQEWIQAYEATKADLARLIGATPAEIAILKNTSECLSTVALGIDWRAGDRVVGVESEFPANLYPWLLLRERGVQVDLLPETAAGIDLDELRRRCQGARLLAISFVQFLSGYRIDLEAVGAICRETGTLFVLDAIQGLGAFPVDVKRAGVDVLAADGHKWLTGPEGSALFYLSPRALAEITPREVGWQSVAAAAEFDAARQLYHHPGPFPWREGSSRFECGTWNTVGAYGLGAAARFLQQVGIANIAERILELTDRLVAGLEERGGEVLGPRRAGAAQPFRSGIVSFRLPDCESVALVQRLEAAGVLCSCRNGWVRCAPHFYNNEAEIDRLLSLL